MKKSGKASKSSEKKTKSAGVKFDGNKLRFDLVPAEAEEAIARVLTAGAKKYGDRNWENGLAYSRLYGALRRHLLKWWKGQERDEESGDEELAHVLTNAAMLYWTARHRKDFDDRPHNVSRRCEKCYRKGKCLC